MSRYLLIALALIALTVACNKKEEAAPQVNETPAETMPMDEEGAVDEGGEEAYAE